MTDANLPAHLVSLPASPVRRADLDAARETLGIDFEVEIDGQAVTVGTVELPGADHPRQTVAVHYNTEDGRTFSREYPVE